VYNWSIDTKRLRTNKKDWEKWQLEQMINFGLGGRKISRNLLLKYWRRLKIDPPKKKFLEFLLWGRK